VNPASAWAITKRAVGFGCTSFASSLQCTPSNCVSNRDQRVTQWMSCTFDERGSSLNCSHESSSVFSTSPNTRSVQVLRSG